MADDASDGEARINAYLRANESMGKGLEDMNQGLAEAPPCPPDAWSADYCLRTNCHCLLFTDYWPLPTVHGLLSTVYCLLSTDY